MYEPMFILKIRLVDSKPEIWRRFAVPGRITLDRLHDVIQIVMGWTDSHLHEFTIGSKHYTEFPQKGDGMLASEKYHLEALAKKRGRTFEYLYDLGDSWKHEITIEHNDIDPQQFPDPIICIDGEGACPPEDVGGIYGYEEFCKVVSNPKHPELKDRMEWLGWSKDRLPYDPSVFDMQEVHLELAKYRRWSRDRHIFWNRLSRDHESSLF